MTVIASYKFFKLLSHRESYKIVAISSIYYHSTYGKAYAFGLPIADCSKVSCGLYKATAWMKIRYMYLLINA